MYLCSEILLINQLSKQSYPDRVLIFINQIFYKLWEERFVLNRQMDHKINSSISPLQFTALWLLWQGISQIKKKKNGCKAKLERYQAKVGRKSFRQNQTPSNRPSNIKLALLLPLKKKKILNISTNKTFQILSELFQPQTNKM